jgi:hypothetical protein
MKTHDQLVLEMMKRPGVNAEVRRIEHEEKVLYKALYKANLGTAPDQHETISNALPGYEPKAASLEMQ